jgi:hypothetical protein
MGNKLCNSNSKRVIKEICENELFKELVSNLYNNIVREEDFSLHNKQKNLKKIQKEFENSKYMSELLKELYTK